MPAASVGPRSAAIDQAPSIRHGHPRWPLDGPTGITFSSASGSATTISSAQAAMLPAITATIVPHQEGSSGGGAGEAPDEASSTQETLTGARPAWKPRGADGRVAP